MDANNSLYVAELTVWDPSIPGTRVLRYSTGTGFVTRPTETPANAYYDARIQQPALIRRDLFDSGTTQGRSRVGFGDLILINNDGALDGLLNYAFDGREIVIRQGAVGAAYLDGFETILVGTMEQPEIHRSSVVVKVRDRQAELDIPLQATKFAGSNVLPAGLEGIAEDLKDKPKPVLYGIVRNIAPPCVNTARLIFQVNDGSVESIDAVYDRGIQLTAGTPYGSEADLLNDSAAPAPGTYKAWPAGGYFRLGGSPAGTVTADVTEGATSADRTAAQIFTRVLQRAGKTFIDWSATDVAALDALNTAPLGFWVSDEVRLSEVIDAIAGSIGAWWGVDRYGVFRIQQFTEPTGSPVLTITANDLFNELDRLATNDQGKGLPVYRCTVRYGRNYTVQTTDLALGVSDARRAIVANEWREASFTNTTVQTAHLLSPETTEDSLLVVEGDAIAEATRRQVLRGVRRDRFELVVTLNQATSVVDLGSVVRLVHPRYDLSSGKLFRVIGMEPNAAERTLSLSVWG